MFSFSLEKDIKMATYKFKLIIIVVLTIGIQEIYSTNLEHTEQTTQLAEISKPLGNLILNENEIGDVNRNGDHTKDTLSRVKRQFYYDYDPYYYRRRSIPIPIIIGGGGWYGGRGFGRGFGGRGFGGRGFGGRGFGGRGFGGRGFGGRGFGGRGFGGRGFGGGRGGFGGGRGGRG